MHPTPTLCRRRFILTLLIATSLFGVAHGQCPPFHTFEGESGGDYLGFKVSGAGDVNNDGYADVMVTAGGFDAGDDRGRVYVFSGLDGDTLHVFTGPNPNARFGYGLAPAGDIDGDDFDDIIIGAYGLGRVFVFSGQTGDTLFVFDGPHRFGDDVAGGVDVNNDGTPDVIVGAYFADVDTLVDAGQVFVFSGVDGDTLHIFSGIRTWDRLGDAVAGIADIDGDGYDDIAASATDINFNINERVIIYSGQTGSILYTFNDPADTSCYGCDIADAGDLDNDSTHDLVVGAYLDGQGGSRSGRVYYYSGATGALLGNFSLNIPNDGVGVSVDSAGDVDGDGYGELLIGAPDYDPGSGHAYVYSPQKDSLLRSFYGAGGRLGESLASAGDVDGDGTSDLIVANKSLPITSQKGQAYIYLLGDADLDGWGPDCDCNDNDPALTPLTVWYADNDGDGYGTPSLWVQQCAQPVGYLMDKTDCNDADSTIHPGATEVCNHIDDDCANGIDDGLMCCECDCHGDPQCDGLVNVLDVVHAVNTAFKGYPEFSDPNPGCPMYSTDVDCSGFTNVLDVVKFVNVAFKGLSPTSQFCDPCAP